MSNGPTFTAAELYAQDEATYKALKAALASCGIASVVEDLDHGNFVLTVTGPNERGPVRYQVYGSWIEAPFDWFVQRGTHGDLGWYDYDGDIPGTCLNLPLDASVDLIAAKTAALLAQVAPDFIAPDAQERSE